MSALFHLIDDVFVILRTRRGIYKQAKLYARGEHVYAGHGGGFVRLFREGTSCPDVLWQDMTRDPRIEHGRIGNPRFLSAPIEAVALPVGE